MEWIIAGVIFVACSIGFLTTLTWGCFAFGCGLILIGIADVALDVCCSGSEGGGG